MKCDIWNFLLESNSILFSWPKFNQTIDLIMALKRQLHLCMCFSLSFCISLHIEIVSIQICLTHIQTNAVLISIGNMYLAEYRVASAVCKLLIMALQPTSFVQYKYINATRHICARTHTHANYICILCSMHSPGPSQCIRPRWHPTQGESVEAARAKLMIIVIATAVLYSVVADMTVWQQQQCDCGCGNVMISAVGICRRAKLEQSCESPCASWNEKLLQR